MTNNKKFKKEPTKIWKNIILPILGIISMICLIFFGIRFMFFSTIQGQMYRKADMFLTDASRIEIAKKLSKEDSLKTIKNNLNSEEIKLIKDFYRNNYKDRFELTDEDYFNMFLMELKKRADYLTTDFLPDLN